MQSTVRLVAISVLASVGGLLEPAHAQSELNKTQPVYSQQAPSYGRAAAEMVGFLGVGATWYWLDIDRNLADWDELSLKQRFSFDAIRLDNNDFAVNHVGHPVSGAFYYTFARANGLSVPTATAYAVVSSMAWEYGLEFQERTSYNDFIVTPGAGVAVGEPIHALGRYLNSGCAGGVTNVLGWVLGFPVALHQVLDGYTPRCDGPRDGLGLDRSMVHHFDVGYGLSRTTTTEASANGYSISATSELIDIDGYGSARSLRGYFFNGEWTRIGLTLSGGRRSGGVHFDTHAIVAGYHRQGVRAGHYTSLTGGVGLGYRYVVRDYPTWRERLSEMHLIGGYYDATYRFGRAALTVRGRVSPDFSASNSLPYAEYRALPDRPRGKSVLRKQAYYYGYGWSGELSMEARYGPLVAGARAEHSELASLQGNDRVQEVLEVDEHARDSRELVGGYFRVELPVGATESSYFELNWHHLRRVSEFETGRKRRAAQLYELRFGAAL